MSKIVAGICFFLFSIPFVPGIVNYCPSAAAASSPQVGSETLGCWVSILPQKYFVERIGGEYVDVHVMVGPGQSPATYEPTGRQLTRLSEAGLYFSIGVAFERSLVPRIERSFENVRVIDTSTGIERRKMVGHAHLFDEESPGKKDDDSHSLDDPHIWLAPRLAIRIAENIREALCEHDPVHTKVYTQNFDALKIDLLETDRQVAGILSAHAGKDIFVFHPAYGYFTDAYGLVQVPIEIEGGTPGPRHLASIIERAETESVTTIFVQPQFSLSPAQTIAKTIGASIVILDPLAEGYTKNSVEMAKRIAAAFTAKTASQ
jgi:zinc transport system substrate-binding protein